MSRKKNSQLFVDYFDEWVDTYKVGAVKDVTLNKYRMTSKRLKEIIPKLTSKDLNRRTYQQMINKYAETHEKATTQDFHHQVKACIRDMFHEGILDRDPTYRTIIKGREPKKKKPKFLHSDELKKLIETFDLGNEVNRDWFLLVMIKTGLRYAEGLGLTPADFDLKNNLLTVNKTWNYKKADAHFDDTKNRSSVRTIAIDWQLIGQFGPMLKGLPEDEPIFAEKNEDGTYKRIFNSTHNNYLESKCKEAGVPVITLHSLRHTHASLLLSAGVSIHSIADRLGHSEVTTTQEVYTHIINDLAQKDNQIMIGTLTALT